jgi:hypothetical protein
VLDCCGVVSYYITKSPKHLDDKVRQTSVKGQLAMNTSITTKLASLALALMANSVIMGGVAYMFNARLGEPTAIASVASTVVVASQPAA